MTRLLAAALLALATAGPARAQEAEDTPRYASSTRSPRSAVLERSEVLDLAAEAFGPELAGYVARIAWCESRHDRTARSAGWDRLFGWFDYRGLLQISIDWSPLALEVTGSDDLFDPWVNLLTGRAIQQRQGWARGWPYCSR